MTTTQKGATLLELVVVTSVVVVKKCVGWHLSGLVVLRSDDFMKH